jgi:hypothetical protein
MFTPANTKNAIRALALSLAAMALLAPGAASARDAGSIALSLDGLELINRTATETDGEIHLNAAPDSGLAWIDGLALNEGCLAIEVRGSNEFGRSFVGIAFRGVDQSAYDAVYVRPFVFQSDNPEHVANGLQYMAMPDFPWPVLRARSPGIYETSIGSTPAPDAWVDLVVRFREGRVQVHVNHAPNAQLDLPLLTDTTGTRVGLWVGNNSSGAFRNLRQCD